MASLTTRPDCRSGTGQLSNPVYNYFPSKAEIVRALIVETYVGPEEDMLNIIKRYEDDLLSSINEINAARFNAIQAADPSGGTDQQLFHPRR